jgi:hypothetical protein
MRFFQQSQPNVLKARARVIGIGNKPVILYEFTIETEAAI